MREERATRGHLLEDRPSIEASMSLRGTEIYSRREAILSEVEETNAELTMITKGYGFRMATGSLLTFRRNDRF
jgi:hypothetical protein